PLHHFCAERTLIGILEQMKHAPYAVESSESGREPARRFECSVRTGVLAGRRWPIKGLLQRIMRIKEISVQLDLDRNTLAGNRAQNIFQLWLDHPVIRK